MIKNLELGYRGMSKDLAKDKQSKKYFNAKNIRILATDQKSSFSATNEHGNELVFSIPLVTIDLPRNLVRYTVSGKNESTIFFESQGGIPYSYNSSQTSTSQTIIGTKDARDSAIIVSTDGNGIDCFWELEGLNDGNFDLKLLYVNDLGLSKENLVQIEYNYESSIIQKIYFVDGVNLLRFMNIRQSKDNGDIYNLVDAFPTSIDTVSTFNVSRPIVDNNSVISGGSHTSGMIQYAYSLYILNGAQTIISPLSELIAIDKGDGSGGGEVDEVLGKSVSVNIPNLDRSFTHIKVYSVKYTSLNQVPEILEVADREIDDYDEFEYYDDGSGGTTLSLEEFAFLGADPIVPKHIATKDNILFPINITERNFNFDIDTRCYGFDSNGIAAIKDSPSIENEDGNVQSVNKITWDVRENHDAINFAYEHYKYQTNGTTLGGEGKFFKVEIQQNALPYSQAKELQFFKDEEIYRLGIIFFNRRGQETPPSWMMDIVAPKGNLEGDYSQLKVSTKPALYTHIDSLNLSPDEEIVGYRIVRAERNLRDKTIICQGIINPMIVNIATDERNEDYSRRKATANASSSNKMPSMMRTFKNLSPFFACEDYADLTQPVTGNRGNAGCEAYNGLSYEQVASNFQYNRLMQMFSPEVSFSEIEIDASFLLSIKGLRKRNLVNNWSSENDPVTGVNEVEAKFLNGITPATPGVTTNSIKGNAAHLSDQSFFGPTNGDKTIAMHQVYHEYSDEFYKANKFSEYNIYGAPEVTDVGQDFRNYNNDPKLRYCNHLKAMLIDNFDNSNTTKDAEVQVLGANSNGSKCITFAEGSDDPNSDIGSRISIEDMYDDASIQSGENDGSLVAEFKKDRLAKYIGGVYGGFSYESKRNSTYIGIGDYASIDTTSVFIASPGDTFVQDFIFSKIVKDDVENTTRNFNLITEIVSVRLETGVDLKNRNDLSLGQWDGRFHPKYEEYNKYNTVYSQQPTLLKTVDVGFKFKKVVEYDARIMASKTKIPGENIDSWTDFLVNESMDLDGKYGPINAVVNSKDEVYVLQDSAVAKIAINPRIQTSGSDGVSIELGTGGILHDYQYMTTKSGCLNKWGVVPTGNGFYYVDILNKAIVQYKGGIDGISDKEGFHYEFTNTFDYTDLSQDNPVISKGISTGYNSLTNDVYFSFHQAKNPFTISYNEATSSFISYYDYIPAWYINKGAKMLSTNPTNAALWEHFKGKKNHFYGQHFPSSITFNASPEGKGDVTFNSSEMRMEMTTPAGLDLPKVGLTKVRVYNEYQDSGQKILQLRKNMFKKNRNWKINMPRVNSTRERVKNPWTFIEYTFENLDGNRMVMHDISVFYTEY